MHVGRWFSKKRRDDQGAVATVFGILLSGGVLLGMLALVVDVGQIYVERAELQSGADAAALAVARACATHAPECASGPAVRTLAERYANDNASDGVSTVEVICGNLAGVLDPCPPANTNMTACLGSPPTFGNYVEVRVVTALPDGSTVLPPSFAQSVIEDFDGASVGACGRAGWQVRIDVPLLGIAMSQCVFDRVDAGDSVAIGDATTNACSGSGGTWRGSVLDNPDPRCEIVLPDTATVGGHLISDLRLPIGGDCMKRLHQGIADHQVVYLPVYDGVSDDLDPTFHIVGAIGVRVTGFLDHTDPSDPPDNWPADDHRCDGPNSRCVLMEVVEKIGPFALVGRSTLGLIG